MNRRTRHAWAVVAVLVVAACDRGPVGYGVVLWSADGELPTGAAVDLIEESSIEEAYLARVAAEPTAGTPPDPLTVDQWRVRRFAEAEQAAAFAASYAGFRASYGYTERSGLPLRAAAAATAAIIYKLRPGELIKVVARGDERAAVGVYENYWYEVLTEDGTVGYTFGEFLVVFESAGDPRAQMAELRSTDPVLERILATVWRPAYFAAMVRSGRYDLERLRADYGLFPDPGAQVFTLVTESGSYRFPYREIERIGSEVYVLHPADDTAGGGASGSAASGTDQAATPVRITVVNPRRIALSHVLDGRLVTPEFLDLEGDVAQLIEAEQGRRDLLYADLVRRGERLTSSSYGTITLGEGRRFRWRGYDALVPSLVAHGLAGTGVVEFRYTPAAALVRAYDGAVTFTFDRPRDPVELTLLVAYDAGSVRLTPALPDQESRLVTDVSESAVVMFFTFSAAPAPAPARTPPAPAGAG